MTHSESVAEHLSNSASLLFAATAGPAVVYGTDVRDSIYGTELDDQLNGRGGSDLFYPYGGKNFVWGGDGIDTVVFRGSYADYNISYSSITGRFTVTDTVLGRDGTTVTVGVEFFSFAFDRSNVVPIEKAPGILFPGTDGDDVLEGGAGGDVLNGGYGTNRLVGGAGNDLLIDYGNGSQFVFRGKFSEYAISYISNGFYTISDLVPGRDGTDLIPYGNGRAEFSDVTKDATSLLWIYGSAGQDVVVGGGNDNDISTGSGNDTIDGGPGIDTLYLTGSYGDYVVTSDPATSTYTVTDRVAGRDGVDTLRNVEYLSVYGGRLPLGPSVGGQNFVGANSADVQELIGGPGDDSLYGGKGGIFTMTGLEGNDFLIANSGAGPDTAVFRGPFADYVITWDRFTTTYAVADKVAGRDGKDTMRSISFLRFSDITIPVVTSVGGDSIVGSDRSDSLQGSTGNDSLNGKDGNDSLAGGAGRDVLLGSAGNDSLDGGADDDWLNGGPGNDKLLGRGGIDVAIFSGNFSEYVIELNATRTGSRISDTLAGRDGVDTFSGLEYLQFNDQMWAVPAVALIGEPVVPIPGGLAFQG